MVAIVCRHCGSESLVKSGFGTNGKQRYKCKACGRRSRESPQGQGHEEAFKEQILAAYDERMSQRGIQRAFGVSRQSLSVWLKKRPETAGGATPEQEGVSGSDSG
ncbi:MAG: IS1 family transposase [Cytophagaceae bacterium]|nr:MAG: IS1 family transposase [Cytophagaceae bacterium]